MRFIVDVTNAHDKECPVGIMILTESKLEAVQNSTWVSMLQNNSIFCIPRMYILCKHCCIYLNFFNLNSFVNSRLPRKSCRFARECISFVHSWM